MSMEKSDFNDELIALAEHLKNSSSHSIEIVVCGGSALQAMGLVERTTKDIDILAQIKHNNMNHMELLSAEPLPIGLVDSAKIVARDFGLPNDWLNTGPTELLNEGRPDGFVNRLHKRVYGEKLIIHYIDRYDQIHFKAYAAVNGGDLRHLSDLKQLNPSNDEIYQAALWCLKQDASDIFPKLVISFLEKVGYEDVAIRVKESI